MKITIATLEDLEELIDHDIRHLRELGYNGMPAHPFPKNFLFEKEKMMSNKEKAWSTPLGETGWSRCFLLIDNDQIVGHLNLKNAFHGTLHRAELGMGIEESMRGKGGGKLLMKAALEWAREQDFIDWIDLGVFSHNLPARKLYESFGFTEICTVKDLIRVDGISIDDVKMVLKIR
ncbi:MAG: GNAT family N-acetyltransferase [Bacteriovorax sp.]|jgi:RimJ/RimL family protein N-acetyltransferase